MSCRRHSEDLGVALFSAKPSATGTFPSSWTTQGPRIMALVPKQELDGAWFWVR